MMYLIMLVLPGKMCTLVHGALVLWCNKDSKKGRDPSKDTDLNLCMDEKVLPDSNILHSTSSPFLLLPLGEARGGPLVLVSSASRSLCSDGEPNGAATVNHEAVACFHVQTGECGTGGIVAGGIDGIACTVHLGSEGHFIKVGAADGYGCDRSRCCHAAARNALANTVDCCHRIEGRIAGCHSTSASTWSNVTCDAGATCACIVEVELRLHVNISD